MPLGFIFFKPSATIISPSFSPDITSTDPLFLIPVSILILFTLLMLWRPLLAVTFDRELAQAEGIPVLVVQLIFMLLVAAVIALSMKIIGILLVTSLLIIPVSTARSFSNTPEQMAIGGALIGISSVFLGLWTSLHFDTPSGPSIVIVAVLLFFASQILPFRKFKH